MPTWHRRLGLQAAGGALEVGPRHAQLDAQRLNEGVPRIVAGLLCLGNPPLEALQRLLHIQLEGAVGWGAARGSAGFQVEPQKLRSSKSPMSMLQSAGSYGSAAEAQVPEAEMGSLTCPPCIRSLRHVTT